MTAIYNIEYFSENLYEEPVTEAIFQFLISPCNDATQTVLDAIIKNSSEQDVFMSKNSYGFYSIRIRPENPFKKFTLSYKATVEKKISNTINRTTKFLEQFDILKSPHFFIENFLYLTKTSLTKISDENKEIILYPASEEGIYEFLERLNEYIFKMIKYEKNLTDIDTTANDVIKLKKGVCQDYTHLFLAIARENNIPSRYTAGYLDQGSNYLGTSMMHAWAEALVPGIGWIGFDPTNNKIVNEQYIKVCHGIDYSDCSPIKGILLTNGINTTSHQVKVVQQ